MNRQHVQSLLAVCAIALSFIAAWATTPTIMLYLWMGIAISYAATLQKRVFLSFLPFLFTIAFALLVPLPGLNHFPILIHFGLVILFWALILAMFLAITGKLLRTDNTT